ncbi:hypothetical protein TRFO_35163 [Tritrichomonas foetus]|uniref:MRG domain-containing protein n=1 Tax=Tritrichomonas foetus TaxID=1144522 RepID=A0A1J4JIA6_9EUKA|nr:hypothetical protein TRFO_35163 [Tritrichomonas foetus]|eukprot:OHS98425.1 hypothetical protein TRFO_35163 [Tritrichomonas foetus]
MSEFNSSHKLSRSRSQRLKGESDSTILHLSRKKPIFVPRSITLVRGTSPRTRQAFLDENQWVTLDESLAQLISHESTMINDFHASHPIPSPLETSAEAFISEFERTTVDLSDKRQTESVRAFCKCFGSIFMAHVALLLLYESEMHSAEVIKQNPLRNSPAMFVLRFLYSFPSLMKNESADTPAAKTMQEHLKELIKFAAKNSKYFFVLPTAHSSSKSGPTRSESRVVIKLKGADS